MLATAYVFSSSVSRGRSWGFLPNSLLTLGQTCIYCEAFRQWTGRDQFLAVGTFFQVFVPTESPPFCLFLQTFPPISELIDLARRVKFNTCFIPRLVVIVFSGTESNCGIKFIPRLARFNLFNDGVGYIQTGQALKYLLLSIRAKQPRFQGPLLLVPRSVIGVREGPGNRLVPKPFKKVKH